MSQDLAPIFLKAIELGLKLLDLLRIAKKKGIPDSLIFEAVEQAQSQNEALRRLKEAGISMPELASTLGVSKQAISSRLGPTGFKVKDNCREPMPIDELRLKVWKEAYQEPDLWFNASGRLNKNLLIKALREANYSREFAKNNHGLLGAPSKAELVLTVLYGARSPEEQRAWLQGQRLKGLTDNEIHEQIQKESRVKFDRMGLSRLAKKLGIPTLETRPVNEF